MAFYDILIIGTPLFLILLSLNWQTFKNYLREGNTCCEYCGRLGPCNWKKDCENCSFEKWGQGFLIRHDFFSFLGNSAILNSDITIIFYCIFTSKFANFHCVCWLRKFIIGEYSVYICLYRKILIEILNENNYSLHRTLRI